MMFSNINTHAAPPGIFRQNLTVPVLCYHRVILKPRSLYDFTPQKLDAHFNLLQQHGYKPITASQFLQMRLSPETFPEKPVLLTFDDGSKSHYTYVLPLLKKYGFQATFFIFPNAITKNSKHFLTWSQLTKISRSGMEIGSHTMFHPYLTIRNSLNRNCYLSWLQDELQDSKKILERKLKIRVNSLAYPFGWYNYRVEAAAIQAGYQGTFSVNWGSNHPAESAWGIKRRVMENSMGLKDLENILTAGVLDLDIISPIDTNIVSAPPVIRFKIKDLKVKTVMVEVLKYKAVLRPDPQGLFSFQTPGKLRTGFIMIIVKGIDGEGNHYLNSWCFDYKPG